MKKVNISKSGNSSIQTDDCEVNPCLSCKKFGYHSAKLVAVVEIIQMVNDFDNKEEETLLNTIEDPMKLLINSFNSMTRKEFDKLFEFGVLKYER
jgi:hypothetical protein